MNVGLLERSDVGLVFELTDDDAGRCRSRCALLAPLVLRCEREPGHDDKHEAYIVFDERIVVDTSCVPGPMATMTFLPGDEMNVTWSDAEAIR